MEGGEDYHYVPKPAYMKHMKFVCLKQYYTRLRSYNF